MKTTEDFKDVLVPKGRDPAIKARDGTQVRNRHGTHMRTRDGTIPCIAVRRHKTVIHIRDGTDIHIRDGTGLGSRNRENRQPVPPPEGEWYALLAGNRDQ